MLLTSTMDHHQPYVGTEPINRLPIKRLYDFKARKLREFTKLPKEFELADGEVLLKVKMVAINYGKDFDKFKAMAQQNTQGVHINSVVPGNKFVTKIYASNDMNLEFALDNSKFLVFPYTNCIQQGNKQLCKSCLKYGSNELKYPDIQTSDHKKHSRDKFPCLGQYELGINLDGGLQDFVKVKNALDLLVQIPELVSSHDALLLLDYALPFYCALKSLVLPHYNFELDKLLIILNDFEREINDVQLVLKLFGLNIANVLVLDYKKVDLMTTDERAKFRYMFNLIFNFSSSVASWEFCFRSIASTGLESTKARYQVVLFNQNNSVDLNQLLFSIDKDYDLNDKIITQFKLNWFHKFDLIELLNHLSFFNGASSRPSFSSIDSYSNHTLFSSNMSINSSSTNLSRYSPLKQKGFDQNLESNVIPNTPMESSFGGNRIRFNSAISSVDNMSLSMSDTRHKTHWLFYEKDMDLSNDFDKFEKSDTSQSLKHINKYISTNHNFTRICYSNKPNKSTKLNAFIFS